MPHGMLPAPAADFLTHRGSLARPTKLLRSRCDVAAAGLAGPAGALSAPTRLEKRGILPEEWRGASPARGRGPTRGSARCACATLKATAAVFGRISGGFRTLCAGGVYQVRGWADSV